MMQKNHIRFTHHHFHPGPRWLSTATNFNFLLTFCYQSLKNRFIINLIYNFFLILPSVLKKMRKKILFDLIKLRQSSGFDIVWRLVLLLGCFEWKNCLHGPWWAVMWTILLLVAHQKLLVCTYIHTYTNESETFSGLWSWH